MAGRRIKSVLQLARYRVGDKPYWVVLRHLRQPCPCPKEKDLWMCELGVHPKVFFRRGWMQKTWPYKATWPKLHAHDFDNIVNLIVCTLVVEQFEIKAVVRCPHTGNFLYESKNGIEWMPEDCLFADVASAEEERRRIIRLLQTWLKGMSP